VIGLGLGGLEGANRDLFWLSDGAWAALEPHLPNLASSGSTIGG
jgi:hypothetical protein